MLKLISNSSEMGNISVYISVKNALLLNELTEILKKRNILVYTKREKIRKTNYLITDDVNIKKSIFTDNTASIYITDIKSDLSKKKITKKLKYFNAVLQFEDLLLKEQNIEILANKIVNVLLSLKRKSFVRHILMSPGNNSQKTNFVEIYKKTMVVICAVFILFSLGLFFLAYVNISKSMEFLLCRTSINPYKTADDLTGVLSGRSSIGNVFENSSKVFHLRSVSLNMNCDIETIKKDIDKVYECLKNKCVDLDFVEDVKNVPKGDVGNTVKDINIKNPKFKSSSLYKTVEDGFLTSLKDYENYKYINDSLINSIANNDSKSILVFFQNSDIPTSFGGKVEKILLYKFRKNKVEARQELDIDELSKRTVNTDFFNKYVKHYLIRDNSLGLNSFYNYDDLYDILGSVIGNMYGIKIDSVVMVNNKFSETLKSSKLSGKIVKAIEEKDLLYYSHNNTIDKRQTNQVCSQNLALSENSFESDLFNPKRHLDIKINKVNKKYIYNILYAYEDELGIPKKMNITVMLPKNSKNISTNPHTWYEEKNNNNVYLETEIDFMKNKILKLQYETDKPTGECSDFYGFGFITQPGSVYDMKFDFAFDEDYLPLNNSSLTESGTRGYNTTLVGQKSDIYFNFYKK